jgi:hypothetical protein
MLRRKESATRIETQRLVFLAAMFFTSFLIGKAQERRATRFIDDPLWKLDLRPLGYTRWEVRESGEEPVTLGPMSFISTDELVITYVSHVVPESLPRRTEPESANLRLNAAFINSETGQVRSRGSWPTTSERSRITPVGDGRYLVITPDKLILASPAVQTETGFAIPIGREAVPGWWDAIPSPKGKYLLMWYDLEPKGEIKTWELIDVANLQIAHAFTEPSAGMLPLLPFDDGNVFAIDRQGTAGPNWNSVVGAPPNGPWHPDKTPWDGCRPDRGVTLINGQAVFGTGDVMFPNHKWCQTLGLTDGEIIFRQDFPEKEQIERDAGLGGIAVSAGGKRFAVAVYKTTGGSMILDKGSHRSINRIMLYDLALRRWTYTLDAKKQRLKFISGLALSPDGSLLALIDQQGILRVYDVP